MAETVLYLINNTDDSTRIAIQPRTFDGVGGVQRNTSLTLYGNNAPRWGEKFNENFFHLLENFAVSEAPGVLPVRPLDETDIGEEGLGINLPILGQTWFNKTRNAMFAYTTTGLGGFRWTPVTSAGIVATNTELSSYTSNRTGDLGFATDTEELKIWNGVAWATVGASGGGPTALSLNDLSDVVLGTPVVGQVLKYNGSYWYNGTDNQASGGGASGTVTSISGTGSIVTSPNPITTTGTVSLVNDTTSPGASRYYGTNSAGVKGFHPVPTGGGGGGGGGVSDHGALTGLGDDDHPQYLLVSGARAMSGSLNMNSNYVINLLNPVNPQDGATKSYVDNKPAGGAFLASGTAGNGASVGFPGGYNHSTCYIITSPTNAGNSGAGAGMDAIFSYATATGSGWTITSYSSKENSGGTSSVTTTYWILSK